MAKFAAISPPSRPYKNVSPQNSLISGGWIVRIQPEFFKFVAPLHPVICALTLLHLWGWLVIRFVAPLPLGQLARIYWAWPAHWYRAWTRHMHFLEGCNQLERWIDVTGWRAELSALHDVISKLTVVSGTLFIIPCCIYYWLQHCWMSITSDIGPQPSQRSQGSQPKRRKSCADRSR